MSKLLPRSRPDRHESGIAHPIQPAHTRGLFYVQTFRQTNQESIKSTGIP